MAGAIGQVQARVKIPWPQPALGPSRSGGPEVLFTFDDGPHEKYTPAILDTLDAYGVKSIFFVAGWRISGESAFAQKRREVAARLIMHGHSVGNHTVNHAHLCSGPADKAAWEIDENGRRLTSLAGTVIRLFRTPYGARCPRLEEMLAARGMQHMHWDLDAREYLGHSATEARDYIIRKLERLQGRAVVLMHDTQPATARALPEILAWLKTENARRVARGERAIRILSPADLAREELAPGVSQVVTSLGDAILDFVPRTAGRLLLPLVHPAQAHTARL